MAFKSKVIVSSDGNSTNHHNECESQKKTPPPSSIAPSYDLRKCSLEEVRDLCSRHHGYGTAGGVAVYCFGVYEEGRIVAGYAWQPPPPGAARAVCPEAPGGVLSLSRMVAVPRDERALKHVSTPLRRQMRILIDRGRWPVLVTYSDEGQGHTGHVYKCSGWEKTTRARRAYYIRSDGTRSSNYNDGKTGGLQHLEKGGHTWMQRWEHHACPRGLALQHMQNALWKRVSVPGKVWRSGNPSFTYIQDSQ